jgi:hypothetical protein
LFNNNDDWTIRRGEARKPWDATDHLGSVPASDRPDTDAFDERAEDRREFTPLPPWLAARLLRDDEKVTWVAGPRHTPSWERYVTHPGLFVAALAAGAVLVGVGALIASVLPEGLIAAIAVAGLLIVGSILVLGVCCGYFTRLVVTSSRLFIIQGYEICRSWNLDDLPLSLLRYRMRGDRVEGRAVDVDSLKTMLGGASDKFADATSILALGKQLNRIKAREKGHP